MPIASCRPSPPTLRSMRRGGLQIHGIEVLTGVGTKSATGTGVELTDGRIIPTSTIVATIGNGPHPLVATLGLDMQWGRIKTDRFMRVPGRDGVWALGDAALIPLVEHPGDAPADYATQTAQFAVREGTQLAAEHHRQDRRRGPQTLRLHLEGLARLARHEQGGCRRLRHQAIRHAGLAAVARLLSLLPAGLRRQIQGRRHLAAQQRHAAQYCADPVDAARHPLHPLPQGRQGVRARHADRRLLYGDQRLLQAHHRQPRDRRAFREAVQAAASISASGFCSNRRSAPASSWRWRIRSCCSSSPRRTFTRFARAFPILDTYFKDYIEKTFGGAEKSFAPGSANHQHELETLP